METVSQLLLSLEGNERITIEPGFCTGIEVTMTKVFDGRVYDMKHVISQTEIKFSKIDPLLYALNHVIKSVREECQ